MAPRHPSLVRFLGVGAAVGVVVAFLVFGLGEDVPYVNGLVEFLFFAVIGVSAGGLLGALAYLIADRPRLGS